MRKTDVLNALRQWLAGMELPAEVLTDSTDRLWVVFETENALAELRAGDGEYAPYRFVSFTVLDSRLDTRAEPVFCFHDNENHTIEDILRELERGLRFLSGR